MAGISTSTAIGVFIFVVVICILIAWFTNPITFEDSRIRVFIFSLAGLGIIIIFLFYYNLVSLQGQQQELAILTQTAILSENVLNSVLKEMEQSVFIIPNFTLSLLPLQNFCITGNEADCPSCNLIDKRYARVEKGAELLRPLSSLYNVDTIDKSHNCAAVHGARRLAEEQLNVDYMLVLPPDECTAETIVRRTVLSYRIFSTWQEVLLSGDFIAITPLAYITNFLQRANSSQLYQVWQVSYIDFNAETQSFGWKLFCKALPITDQRPEVYVQAAREFLADPSCANFLVHM